MDNNDFLKNFFYAFLRAWNIFFEMPFPGSDKFSKRINSPDTENDDLVLYALPFVGLMVGFVAFVIIAVVYFLFGPIASAVICSIAVVSIWEVLTQGKDTTALITNLTSRWENFSSSKMRRTSSDSESNYVYIYIFITVLVLRVLSLGFLIHHHYFGWVIVTTVLVMSVQGHLASIGANNKSKEIYIRADAKEQTIMWIISGIICVIVSGFALLPTVCAFALILFLGIKAKKFLDANNMLNGEVIGIMGKYTEILVLIIGLVFITYIK